MIDLKRTVTSITEITKVPSFIDPTIAVCDAYCVAKNELPSFVVCKDYDNIIEFASTHFDDLVKYCGRDFVKALEGEEEDVAFTMIVYASYVWCVKISTELRIRERRGQLKRVDPMVVPEGTTIH